jgi:hypothetical protein
MSTESQEQSAIIPFTPEPLDEGPDTPDEFRVAVWCDGFVLIQKNGRILELSPAQAQKLVRFLTARAGR